MSTNTAKQDTKPDVSEVSFKEKLAYWKSKEKHTKKKTDEITPPQKKQVIPSVTFEPIVVKEDDEYKRIVSEYAKHVHGVGYKFFVEPIDLKIMDVINKLYAYKS